MVHVVGGRVHGLNTTPRSHDVTSGHGGSSVVEHVILVMSIVSLGPADHHRSTVVTLFVVVLGLEAGTGDVVAVVVRVGAAVHVAIHVAIHVAAAVASGHGLHDNITVLTGDRERKGVFGVLVVGEDLERTGIITHAVYGSDVDDVANLSSDLGRPHNMTF